LLAKNTTAVQLFTAYTDPDYHNMHSVTDRQTDRQTDGRTDGWTDPQATDGRHHDGNSRPHCVAV